MKRSMGKALSGRDIEGLIDGKARLLSYRDLQRYDSIEDALGPHKALVLLYESKPGYGHWTLVFQNNKGELEHFDSYGYKPDQEIEHIPSDFIGEYNEIPHLLLLMYKSGKPIRYSEYKLQGRAGYIATCGRWVALRLILRDLTEDEFSELTTNSSLSPDELVTRVTDELMAN